MLIPSGGSGTNVDNSNVTPLSDFEYYLGSEYSTVDSFYIDFMLPSVSLGYNDVLLTKYMGDSTDVNVLNTYTVDGVTYMANTFQGCTSLVNVPEIPSSVTKMISTFMDCTSLTGIVRISISKFNGLPTSIFEGTSLPITVEVPAGSTAYEQLNYANTNLPSNVTLSTFTAS